MNTRQRARGFSLIETMASLAILAVAALGLMGSMLVASGSNTISRRRTDMTLFAQSRIERLASRTRAKVPTATTTTPVNCSAMAVGGAFDPNANPGTGGWMLDVTNAGVTTFMLRVWVRVIQGGVPWQNSYVLMREDIAQ